jgi:hypothetical protein
MAERRQRSRQQIDIFVVGHSYVRRLQEFMDEVPAEASATSRRNLGLTDRRFHVSCRGLGGADLRSGRRGATHQRFVEFINRPCRPSVVFIHIGENDLLHGENPRDLVRHIRNLVSDVTGPDRVVYVSQLLSFPAMPQHRQQVMEVNAALQRMWSGCGSVRYWRHRGLWSPEEKVFDGRGVHLNTHGAGHYWHSVRTAVIKGCEIWVAERSLLIQLLRCVNMF